MKGLQEKIAEMCEAVMKEGNPDRLLELMKELDKLFDEFIETNRRAPRRSQYAKDAERYMPKEVDVEWARAAVLRVNSGGIIVLPDAGLAYRIDHDKKTMTLDNPEQLNHFDSYVTHLQTIATFSLAGYTVNERLVSKIN